MAIPNTWLLIVSKQLFCYNNSIFNSRLSGAGIYGSRQPGRPINVKQYLVPAEGSIIHTSLHSPCLFSAPVKLLENEKIIPAVIIAGLHRNRNITV
jgi:hypothetical protein